MNISKPVFTAMLIGTVVTSDAAVSELWAAPLKQSSTADQVVCGKITSIGAPINVHAKAQLFGFRLSPFILYKPQVPPPSDMVLGVSNESRNSSGLISVLSAGYLAGKNVTVFYRHDKLLVSCVVTQEKDCKPPSDPPDPKSCVDEKEFGR